MSADTTIPKSPFAVPKSAHVHTWTALSMTYTSAGIAKLTLVCACGGFKHIPAFDVDAPKAE